MRSKKLVVPSLLGNEHTSVTSIGTKLNRRQFLRQVGISAGTATLAAQSMPHAFAASPAFFARRFPAFFLPALNPFSNAFLDIA